MNHFQGIYPAIITPYDEKGEVNSAVLDQLIDFHLANGVHGFWVTGSTGEGILLSEKQRKFITQTIVRKSSGRGKIIVHVGAPDTDTCIRLAKHAEKVGADGIAALPPFFYLVDQQAIVDHYRLIGEACSLPLFAYNLPIFTQVHITADLMGRILEVPTVIGIKFTEHNLVEARNILDLAPDRLSLLFGHDGMLLGALAMGAHGGVGGSYNYLSRATVLLYESFRRGDLSSALEIQYKLTRIHKAMGEIGGLSVTKECVGLLGFECGPPKRPIPPLDRRQKADVRELFEENESFIKSGT